MSGARGIAEIIANRRDHHGESLRSSARLLVEHRYRHLVEEKISKAKEKDAIKARVAEAREGRRWYQSGAEPSPAGPSTDRGEPSACGGGGEGDEDAVSELQGRCRGGAVLRFTLGAREPLSRVAEIVSAQHANDAPPFALRVPFPRREFSTAEELATTVGAAGLVPRGTLIVLSEADRGVVRCAAPAGAPVEHALPELQSQMQQALAGLGAGLEGDADPGSMYEAMLELQRSMGGEVAHGLKAHELASLRVRVLGTAMEGVKCAICCCDPAVGDRLMTLACGYEFHLECVSTWLHAKRICPCCKQDALPAPSAGVPSDAGDDDGDDDGARA